jgi:hypothetical protein
VRASGRPVRLVMAVLACTAIAWTDGYATEGGFFDRAREGWFWYQDPPQPPRLLEDVPSLPSLRPKAPMTWEELKRIPLEQVNLNTLPARWLRAITDAKREYALDDPTPNSLLQETTINSGHFPRQRDSSFSSPRPAGFAKNRLRPYASSPIPMAFQSSPSLWMVVAYRNFRT